MDEFPYDIVGIGNALVDYLGQVDDACLSEMNLEKASRTLVSSAMADAFAAKLRGGTFVSGGSVANTLVWMARQGARVAMIGAVGSDDFGHQYREGLAKEGVVMLGDALEGRTGRCIVGITADGERTMASELGVSNSVGRPCRTYLPTLAAKACYVEGYLFDSTDFPGANLSAVSQLKRRGVKIALTLSDRNCVARHRPTICNFIHSHVDILIGNAIEFESLLGQSLGPESTLPCQVAVMSNGSNPPFVSDRDKGFTVGPVPHPVAVVDTTGAGDAFAAGFLFGWLRGDSAYEAMQRGCDLAADVIAHIGARPEGG